MPGELIRYPFTEQGLYEALTALGTTPQAVATNLGAMGFSGELNEPRSCPVANYLRTSLEGAQDACVGKDDHDGLYAEVEREASDCADSTVDMPVIPPPVAQFVVQFDDKRFPDLIKGWM